MNASRPPNTRSALDPGTRRILLRFAPMIYGPTLLFGLGEGALFPLLPVLATRLGADVAQAALIASVIVVARLVGNLPASWLVARIGERWAMMIGGCLAFASGVGLLVAANLLVLAVSVLGIGLCASVFGLARHAFMTRRAPIRYRARAISVLGGSFRLGMFAGPFVAAGLLSMTGSDMSAVWFFIATMTGLILLVLFGTDPEEQLRAENLLPASSGARADSTARSARETPTGDGVLRTMWRYRSALLTLGAPAAAMSSLRQARVYLLPLWGVSLGMDASSIALVVGITGAIEFGLFYTSGQIMDRWGRLWAAVPSMVLMGGAFLGLAFTHDVDTATTWFVVGAVVVGLGNGVSSGILMTLGADIAPPGDPAPFLGSWRTLVDMGAAAAPLMIAGIAAVLSLPVATAAIGILGLIGAAGFVVFLPRASGAFDQG